MDEADITAAEDKLGNSAAERYPNRGLGIDRGRFEVPDDFDDALPPEIMRYFT